MTEKEKLIKEAWTRIVETRPDYVKFSEAEIKQTLHFSDSFNSVTQTLPKKYIYISGKAFSKIFVGVLIAVIVGSSVTVYAVLKIFETYVNSKNTDISISEEKYNYEKILERYIPDYVPVDFLKKESDIYEDTYSIHYSNGNYDIFFRQILVSSEGQIDNENTEEETIIINGVESIFFEKHQEKTLIHYNYGYVFYIDSNSPYIAKEDLVKMAELLIKEK